MIVQSMPKRVKEVLKDQGGHESYHRVLKCIVEIKKLKLCAFGCLNQSI